MKRLLIIDDDAATIMGFERYYKDKFKTRFASNYEEAMSILDEWQPDLAIVDVDIPYLESQEKDILGFTLAKEIKSINRDIGIVMFTAYNDHGDLFYNLVKKNAFRGFAYVLKGCRLQYLDHALEAVSRLEIFTDPKIKLNRISVETFLSTLTEEELEIVLVADEAINHLSQKELKVMEHIAGSYNNHQIAHKLGIKNNTVETHITNIYKKLYINNHDLNPRTLVTKVYMLYKIKNSD